MSYRDIEDSITTFDGTNAYSVEQWINDFDDNAELFGWNNIQKVIYAKRSLTGLAKLFIQSEGVVKTWDKFKSKLIEEFGTTINSANLHEMLSQRRMKTNETIDEYFLIMKALTAKGNIKDDALMTYVINGIKDDERNKAILYTAKNIKEFKERLKIYEKIQKNNVENKSPKEEMKPKQNKCFDRQNKYFDRSRESKTRCYNCGENGHQSKHCKSKEKGSKCFACNEFGHLARNCPSKGKQVNNVDQTRSKFNALLEVTVECNELCFKCLLDTGSTVNLVRTDVYDKIGKPPLEDGSISLSGIGENKVITKGSFKQIVNISDNSFDLLFHVVHQDDLKFEMVIGTEILQHAELHVKNNVVRITKIDTEQYLMHIADMSTDLSNELDLIHIKDKRKQEMVTELLNNYEPKKTETTEVKMKIIVSDEIPVYQTPRRVSFSEKQIIEQQINEWLENGIIRPSCSEYASPIVLVKKKDGTTRLCVDFRKLNRKVIKDRFPLPLIEDVLDKLQPAKIFSTLDLRNGFFHVEVDEASRKYTSFVVPDGQYEFLKVPFGFCNSPSVFQRFIYHVFRDLMKYGIAIPYMDDVIIPAADENEGIQRLKLVLETASKYGLEIKTSKCQLLQRKVEFLGHTIENGTVKPSPLKTKAVQNFPEPKTEKQVQSFLGLTGYFRKYIPGYSCIAKPLSDLLRKTEPFKFGLQQIDAFRKLKKLLSCEPVLHIFRHGSNLELHTDASQKGYGAVLLQESEDGKYHPIHYMSKKTSPAEEKYSSYELEVLAIIEALKKFRVYLWGETFKIVTDCSAFQKTMDKKDLTTRVARWALFLEDFHYEIIHRPGKQMKHADALSRYPVMITTCDEITPKIIASQLEDEYIATIRKLLNEGKAEDYILKQNVLYKYENGRELLLVPRAMQTEVIRRAHEKGHFSACKTEEILKLEFFIPKLRKHTESVIANCVQCILSNRKAGKQEGFLKPIPKEDVPLSTYHIDFIGPLPSTNKSYQHIFTVVDAFTKFTWLYPVKSTTSRDTLDKLKLQQKTFGNPSRIITDRGAAFTSKDFSDYCADEGIEHFQITTGVPRGNGQVERIHGTLIPVLTKLSIDEPTKWFKHVDSLQRILNSTICRSTKWTPFELMTGVKMKNKEELILKEVLEEEAKKYFAKNRESIREDAKKNILKIQEENRKTFNRKRKAPNSYKVGELVAIKRTQFGTKLKLCAKFLGPYKVSRVRPHDRYDVTKIGVHDGPINTSTSADNMKRWHTNDTLD